MRKPAIIVAAASALAVVLGSMTFAPLAVAGGDMATLGKKIAENRKKGNCFTCHSYKGAFMAGNVGPPLIAMKSRFPDRKKLYDQIYDATKANPNSVMPPFGRHEILSKKEIEAVVDWVLTL